MSFIPKQDKTPKTRINVHLRADVAEQAKHYAGYLDSDLDHVVEQLFLKAFKADKEFQKTAGADRAQPAPVPVLERTTKAAKKPEATAERVA